MDKNIINKYHSMQIATEQKEFSIQYMALG